MGKERSKFKHTVLIFCIGLLIICIGASTVYFATSDQRNYNYGVEQYSIENYQEAAGVFKQLGDYKDSEELYEKSIHLNAISNDTTPPQIISSQETISLTTDDTFSIDDWVKKLNVLARDDVSGNVDYIIESDEVTTDAPGTYPIYITAKDEAGNEAQKIINVNVVQADSVTVTTYKNTISLNSKALNQTEYNKYSYNQIPISKDEIVNVKGELLVNQGAVYRSLAKMLEGFYILGAYQNWGNTAVKTIFGFDKPETAGQLRPHVTSAVKYINRIHSIIPIMLKFSRLNSISGTFNFVKKEFNFSIPDTAETAKELGISEEMLGYLLAYIDEYSPVVTANGKSYSCELNVFHYPEIIPLDYNDFVTIDSWEEFGCQDLISYADGEMYWMWHCYDPNIDSSKEDIITTMRGIQIGSSKDDVFYAYGEAEAVQYSEDTDITHYSLLQDTNSSVYAGLLSQQAKTRIIYQFKDKGQIAFYFDDSEKVTWIVYCSGIWY